MSKGIVLKNIDELLTTIGSIKNLESVKVYDLTSYVQNDTRTMLLPAILIIYDGGKYLNLSAKDKYFDVFAKKVQSVYNEEKDKLVIDKSINPFRTCVIDIDDKSKHILESGNLSRKSLYDDKKAYDYSLFYDMDELFGILPIIKYHLKELFDKTNIPINYYDNKIDGYKKYFRISCTVDGLDDNLILTYKKNEDNSYDISIRSYKNHFPTVDEHIIISSDVIDVTTTIDKSNIRYEKEYEFINNPKVVERLYKNDNLLFFNKEDIEKCNNPYNNLVSIDKPFNGIWYKLPWNAYYGISEELEEITLDDRVVSRDSKYLSINDDSYLIHDDYNKKYFKQKKASVVTSTMELDRIKRVIKGKKLSDDIYIIETNIDDKYHYEIANVSKLDDISKDKMIYISKDNNIIYSGDLYDTNCIKKLVIGGNKNGIN